LGSYFKLSCYKSFKKSQEKKERLQVHYLSPETQKEFVKECSVAVKAVILDERQEAKYYAILIDATPDSAHKEQETFILRYVRF
jgi:hypothetical protein